MSHDVYFQIDTGAGYDVDVADRNYTSNAGKMWARALISGSLAAVINRNPKATDLGPIVRAAATRMRDAGRAAYADVEPDNGWGDYAGALEYLEWIADMCEKHPACTVYVSA